MGNIIKDGVGYSAVYKGNIPHSRAYLNSQLVWEYQQPMSSNLLETFLVPRTVDYGDMRIVVNEDKTITLYGYTESGNINVKLSNTLEADSARPVSWDSDMIPSIPMQEIRLGVEYTSGEVWCSPIADSLNLTLRYSVADIFLNCRIGAGIRNITGTPTRAIKMCVLFIRNGLSVGTDDGFTFKPYVEVV